MVQFLETILSGIWSIFEVLKNVLWGIRQVVFITVPNALAMLTAVVSVLPSILAGFALAFIMGSIVYLIVGR